MLSFSKNILNEAAASLNVDLKKLENKCVVTFPGRFQPFHPGHYAAYKHLCDTFGADNVYITTSNVTNDTDSPFTYAQKTRVMGELYGIDRSHIIKTEQPYSPSEILDTIKDKKTSHILAIGSKDVERLYNNKSFVRYNGICNKPFTEVTYYYEIPSSFNLTSGTVIRKSLASDPSKKNFFNIFGKFNAKVYDLLINKLYNPKQSRVEYYMNHYKNISPSDFKVVRGSSNKIIIEVAGSPVDIDGQMPIPPNVRKLHRLFKNAGKKLYIVGGAVRDFILGKPPKDYDVVTDAKTEEVIKIAIDNRLPYTTVGKAFGVVLIDDIDVASMRKDIGKGRRPDSVEYSDIHGDVNRRDLTINALFYDLDKEEIVDLVGGVNDLKNREIRTVGLAKDRFEEDKLRKLRALRFSFAIPAKLHPSIYAAIKEDPSLTGATDKDSVSVERIREEFTKTLQKAVSTSKYLEALRDLRMMEEVFPRYGSKLKSDSFIDDDNYLLVLSYLFVKTTPDFAYKYLHALKYTNHECSVVMFLLKLTKFTPETVADLKREQKKINSMDAELLPDTEIIRWGNHIGVDLRKFVKFKLSVNGDDVKADGFKKNEVGDEIRRRETELYTNMNESVSAKGIKTFRDLLSTAPDEIVKRVMALKNVPQRLDYHPEGNTLKHTIMVVTRALKSDDMDLAIAALIHDIGKDSTAKFNPKTGYDSHIGHEYVSADLVKKYSSWIREMGGNPANIFYIVKNHMKMKQFDKMRPHKQGKLSSFRAFPKLQTFSSKFDKGGLGESASGDKTITFLIGPPASGKSTWVKNNTSTSDIIISRDDLVDKHRQKYNLSYAESFLDKELQNAVNAELESNIKYALKSGKNIVVDMTNMTKFARKRLLDRLPDGYVKRAVVFEVPRPELNRRLTQRASETGKDIPMNVVDRMIATFEPPTRDEFDDIQTIKSSVSESTILTEKYLYISDASCDSGQSTQLVEFWDDVIEEAEYRGRKVKLNKPMRGDVKKFKVYVKDPQSGNVRKVNFGDPEMRIKKSDPERRKSFRARHNCDDPGPKTKARYWSCKKW